LCVKFVGTKINIVKIIITKIGCGAGNFWGWRLKG